MPDATAAAPAEETTRQGYHLLHWTQAGMVFWAASDLNTDELKQFALLIQSRVH